jgi:hypothetical protein
LDIEDCPGYFTLSKNDRVFFWYFFSALPEPARPRKALGLNGALDDGGRGEVATVSVPGQAGAQHSLSPIKAEDSAMMPINGPTAQKFRSHCLQ